MIFSEKGEQALTAQGHSQMAESYERAGADPRLRPDKRQEYLEKARRARELAQKAKVLEGIRLRRSEKAPGGGRCL
jgi:hypothetical protein